MAPSHQSQSHIKMANTSAISFDLNTTDPDCAIGIAVWINDVCVFETAHLKEPHRFSHDINDDDEREHELRVVMSGKSAEHTKIDDAGNILKDVLVLISNVDVDGIDINQVFLDKTVYTHDFNGTQSEIADTFHGCMGCNGALSMRFSTPVYLWLLENM